MENSKIAWTDHTFSPWIGCTKVSAGCDNCYAENLMDSRFGRAEWGAGNPRTKTKPANWNKVRSWNRRITNRRQRVFCASLSDVFDSEVDDSWREELFDLIDECSNLDWLLLTKRPAVMRRWFGKWAVASNIWCGTTVESQDTVERIHTLSEIDAAVRFVSVEPMLGPVTLPASAAGSIDWVICGGESGSDARNFDPRWARDLRDQCADLGINFFMKQMGGTSKKELEAIPEDLMVREFPVPIIT